MSDTSDLKKSLDVDRFVYCPAWLIDMPESWFDAYFEIADKCAVSMKWHRA